MSFSGPPRYVEELKVPLVTALAIPDGVEVLNLGTNGSPYGPPQAAVMAVRLNAEKLHRYCDPRSTVLRQALGEFHGIKPDQIVCGNGSEELLDVVTRLYARPGDEVLQSEYGYRQFEIVA
jgi:histidinol-phosphate aminotransferase